jgi:thioredoxin reductase
MHKLIIIGSGPAGMAAAVSAAKKRIKTLVVATERIPVDEKESLFVQPAVLNSEFDEPIKQSAFMEYKQATVHHLEKNITSFSIETTAGQILYVESIVIATGQEEGEGRSGFETITNKDSKSFIKVTAVMETSVPGLFAAGSIVGGSITDLVIVVGQGAQAVFSAERYLQQRK